MMMTIAADEGRHFSRLIEALRPWLDDMVIAGGWAHRLYRHHPLAQAVEDYPALMTDGADVALPERLLARESDIREALRTYGFGEELIRDERPPVTHYTLGTGDLGFNVEFLAPLRGGENRRDGTPVTTTLSGVVAQKLRHLELLLVEPWQVELKPSAGTETPTRSKNVMV